MSAFATIVAVSVESLQSSLACELFTIDGIDTWRSPTWSRTLVLTQPIVRFANSLIASCKSSVEIGSDSSIANMDAVIMFAVCVVQRIDIPPVWVPLNRMELLIVSPSISCPMSGDFSSDMKIIVSKISSAL